MFTFIVLCVIAYFWYSANSKYEATSSWSWRRKRAAYAWAFAGAAVGSFFGVAGMGSAIAGTIPCGVIGYLLASNLMKADVDPTQPVEGIESTAQYRYSREEQDFNEDQTELDELHFESFEDWLDEFKRGAGDANSLLATSEKGCLIDFMDHTPLRSAFEEGNEPYELGMEYGEQFSFPDFVKKAHGSNDPNETAADDDDTGDDDDPPVNMPHIHSAII